MPKKTELCMLIHETKRRIHLAKDIIPFVRHIECGVNNTKTANPFRQLQFTQPRLIFVSEVSPRPGYRLFGLWSELREFVAGANVFIVVSFHDGATQTAHDLHTLMGARMVYHEISETDIMGRLVRFSVGQNGLQRLQVSVDVPKNGESHRGIASRAA